MFDLTGKVAVVTGASRGIGRAISETLARRGAFVAMTDILGDAAVEAAREVAAAGVRAEGFAMDVTSTESVQATVDAILERHTRLDILVNNAGIARDNVAFRMKREDWDAVLNVNLTGTFTCSQAVLRTMMRQRSGRIISISSVVGQMGNAGQANYAASKAGIIGFSKALAREVAVRGITVNVVAPGLIDTDMTRGAARAGAERVGVEGSARPARHRGGRRVGRLLPGDRRGVVYLGAGSRRQRRDVHVGG